MLYPYNYKFTLQLFAVIVILKRNLPFKLTESPLTDRTLNRMASFSFISWYHFFSTTKEKSSTFAKNNNRDNNRGEQFTGDGASGTFAKAKRELDARATWRGDNETGG